MVIFYAWLLYPFATWTCWWYWLIILLILVYQICSCHDYPAHFDMRVHFVVYLVCLSVDYLDHLWACYPHYYSSWLLYFLLSLCVDLDDIHVLCMTVYCMTSFLPCDCMSCLSMWDTHLSPCLQVPSLGQPCFTWSRIWYETCCFIFSSTKLVIRSRV